MIKTTAAVLLSLFCVEMAYAHPPNKHYMIPAHEVTPETQLWLTRMFILERGLDRKWRVRREHALLAFIGRARYLLRKKLNPEETFVDTIRQYSKGLQKSRDNLTQKMMWVRALKPPKTHMEGKEEVFDSAEEPEFWPENLSWARHAPAYGRTWINAGKWLHNRVGNPCPGALHWGMPGVDPVPKGMRILRCSKTFNNDVYGR